MVLKNDSIAARYCVATIGLLLVALGVALSILANLGTAPLSCPAYVLSLRFSSISVGTFTLIVNTSLILIQLAFWRKNFKWSYLMQILASAIFGYMIDFWIWLLASAAPAGIAGKLIVILIAGIVSALGVSLEVISKAWMLSAEMTVQSISDTLRLKFSNVKIAMDSVMVVVAAALCWAFFGNPFGSGEFTGFTDLLLAKMPGIVIGLSTLILAVIPGLLMKLTDPLVARIVQFRD